MKYLMLASLMAIPSMAFASGKFSIEPSYSVKAEKFGGQSGLAIYEHIAGPVYYNQWTGVGLKPHVFDDAVTWAASKHAFDIILGRITVSPGYKFEFNNAELGLESGTEHSATLKLSYAIW